MERSELELYLKRLGTYWNHEDNGELKGLQKLHQLHPKHIVFENIDSFMGIVPSLDIGAIFHKLVTLQRGGYCYEQNILFKNILTNLGFTIKMHLARVLWNSANGKATARSHMMLTTDIKGLKYLVDVGFGSMTLTSPILLQANIEQETPNGVFRLVNNDIFYQLEVLKEEWLPIYKFSLEEVEKPDLEMANWFVATGPDSVFGKSLMISRVDEKFRYSLFNHAFTIRGNDGRKESLEITEPDQLRFILSTHFNLDKLSDQLLSTMYNKMNEIRIRFQTT